MNGDAGHDEGKGSDADADPPKCRIAHGGGDGAGPQIYGEDTWLVLGASARYPFHPQYYGMNWHADNQQYQGEILECVAPAHLLDQQADQGDEDGASEPGN